VTCVSYSRHIQSLLVRIIGSLDTMLVLVGTGSNTDGGLALLLIVDNAVDNAGIELEIGISLIIA
jgi:hypothetical protein